MSTKELKESSAALKSFKNPVFESRIRTLDKEICKRENKADVHAILEHVDRLAASVDKSINKLQNIKYEKKLASLITEAKEIIAEAKTMCKNKASKKLVSENKHSISNICSDDISIAKFNEDRQINETIDTFKLFNSNKDNSALERMCSNFRRNSYE
jgi:hypothetical protein